VGEKTILGTKSNNNFLAMNTKN